MHMSTAHTKYLATQVQLHAAALRGAIHNAVEQSVVGRDEVPFIHELVTNLPAYLNPAFAAAGINAQVRATVVHKRPIVGYTSAAGNPERCELADILFVVKYLQPNGTFDGKAILHQAKATKTAGSMICDIDQRQLELLVDWPTFEFGLAAAGGPQPYSIAPTTQEFGSYMLMRRRPVVGQHIAPNRRDYGIAPSAWIVSAAGPATANISALPFSLLASSIIFNHVAFIHGEPHATAGVQQLVNALYRYVSWLPDPPDEFDGYSTSKPTATRDPLFAIFEVKITGIRGQ